jgi:hypothetical protein
VTQEPYRCVLPQPLRCARRGVGAEPDLAPGPGLSQAVPPPPATPTSPAGPPLTVPLSRRDASKADEAADGARKAGDDDQLSERRASSLAAPDLLASVVPTAHVASGRTISSFDGAPTAPFSAVPVPSPPSYLSLASTSSAAFSTTQGSTWVPRSHLLAGSVDPASNLNIGVTESLLNFDDFYPTDGSLRAASTFESTRAIPTSSDRINPVLFDLPPPSTVSRSCRLSTSQDPPLRSRSSPPRTHHRSRQRRTSIGAPHASPPPSSPRPGPVRGIKTRSTYQAARSACRTAEVSHLQGLAGHRRGH